MAVTERATVLMFVLAFSTGRSNVGDSILALNVKALLCTDAAF
jgi:hypothetical protein